MTAKEFKEWVMQQEEPAPALVQAVVYMGELEDKLRLCSEALEADVEAEIDGQT